MSEGESGDGGKTGAFLLGFLLGVLVCLGAGSAFFVAQARQMRMGEERARDAEAMARMEAERAREAEWAAQQKAEKALLELKAKEKAGKEKPKE
jgi:hypothetical protein